MSCAIQCCKIHGCKYGYGPSCKVEIGEAQQEFPCESCFDISSYPVTRWEIGKDESGLIFLDVKYQIDGSRKYAIYRYEGSLVLNKDGQWEYEPLPSSRSDDYLARCRFESPAKALEVWWKMNHSNSEYTKKNLSWASY